MQYRGESRFWFPGKWVGGSCLILGPAVLLAGILLRVRYNFFFPDQLAAYQQEPLLMTVSYSLFALGNVLLVFGVAALVQQIGKSRPFLASSAGILVIAGLIARTFHAGADYLAFQLVNRFGAEEAAAMVGGKAYSAFHIFRTANPAILFGWLILAYSVFISREMNPLCAFCIALAAGMPLGVLKGTTYFSIAGAAGLCLAFVPYGIKMLKQGERVSPLRVALGILAVCAVTALFAVVGQLG